MTISLVFSFCIVRVSGDDKDDAAVEKNPRNAARTRPESLTFKVLSRENKQAVAGAHITVQMYGARQRMNLELVTDDNGEVKFEYPDGDESVGLAATVRASGLVVYYVSFGNRVTPATLPIEKTILMDRGKKIGGVIVDENGKPVAGAQLSITMPATDTPSTIHYHLLHAPSNEDGSWELNGAPLNLNGLSIAVSHPRYLRSGLAVQDKTNARYVLDPGLQLTGHVTDENGKPIPVAQVTVGRDRWGRDDRPAVVDKDGKYVVYALRPESTWVTAEAPGFAPQAVQIDLNKAIKPVDLQLKPGETIRFRVVDRQGAPLQGIRLYADKWNGLRTLWWQATTDVNGEAVWDSAPPDAVEFDFVNIRHIARRNLPLRPQDDPHVIVMTDQCTIQGIVVDDKKVKIPEFKATLGYKLKDNSQMNWHYQSQIGRNGKFELVVDETYDEVFVRVEATGYRTWISDAIDTDKSPQKLFAKIERRIGPAGVVLSPDGQPVANAQLTLVIPGGASLFYQSGFKPRGGQQTIASGEQGQFEFIAVDGEFLISAVSDSGYAEISSAEFEKTSEVRLQAWAALEVTTRRGDKPLPSAKISISSRKPNSGGLRISTNGLNGQTDEHGRLNFSRVMPQPIQVSVLLEQRIGPMGFNTVERSINVQLEPGKKSQVELGGTGATVRGRFELAGKPPLTHHWQSNEPIRFLQRGSHNYSTLVRDDGSFEMEDLPFGKYTLQLDLTAVPDANQPSNRTRLGKIQRAIELIPGQPILDLGQVAGAFDKRLRPGDAAPFFIALGMSHAPIKLSDLRGRLVLIDFWSAIRSNSKSEMKKLAELNDELKDDPRFQILSLSVDSGSPPVEKTGVKNDSWLFGYVGPVGSLIPNRFGIQQYMERFLIDVDGTILHRGYDLEQIVPLIRQRLDEWPTAADLKPPSAAGIRPRVIDDPYVSNQVIDVAAVIQPSDLEDLEPVRGQLLFWSSDGKLLRSIDGIDGRRAAMAIDGLRERLFVCNSRQSELLAFDRSGRQLFASEVSDLYSIAVDERTGDLWCLARTENSAGELVVLDSSGAEKSRHLIHATELIFSPADDAFWMEGEELFKMDRDAKILFRQPAKPDSQVRYLEVDRQQGGVWYIGGTRDVKQLCRMASEGEPLTTHDFAAGESPIRMSSTEQGLWIVVARRPPAGVKPTWSSIPREIQLFDRDGKFLKRLEIPAQALTRRPQANNLWLQTDGKLLKVDSTGQTLQTIPLPEKMRSAMTLAF